MTRNDVYMHGQILGTHSFLLKDGFLKPDVFMDCLTICRMINWFVLQVPVPQLQFRDFHYL